MKVVQEATDIIRRRTVQKAQEVEAARATYRTMLLAGDDPKPGDAEKLVDVLAVLEMTVGDAMADAKAIAARRKVEREIAVKDAEAARLTGEADALKPVIADPSRADETIERRRQLQAEADGSGGEARQLRQKMRTIEQSAQRIYGKW